MEREGTSLNSSVINLVLKNKRILSLVVLFAVRGRKSLRLLKKLKWNRSSADIDFLLAYSFDSVTLTTKKNHRTPSPKKTLEHLSITAGRIISFEKVCDKGRKGKGNFRKLCDFVPQKVGATLAQCRSLISSAKILCIVQSVLILNVRDIDILGIVGHSITPSWKITLWTC